MGTITTAPPIFRFFAWLQYRKTLCAGCHKEPRIQRVQSSRYCSDACAEWDLHMQAHG